jgi:hypothetical protein
MVGAFLTLTHAGFGPGVTAGALLVACVLLAAVALLRGSSGLGWRLDHSFPGVVALCVLPALVLTGVVVWRVGVAAREPGPAYTEFAIDSPTSVTVRSHERTVRRFRLESTVAGQPAESAEFDLRPGESARFVVFGRGPGSVRARLFVAGEAAPYRELTL